MSRQMGNDSITADEFETALQQLLRSAHREDVGISGAYYVESSADSGFEVHITAVEG